MSVTGHNDVRRADDYYATPAWCVRAILPHLVRVGLHIPPSGKGDVILDPCAGDGAILRVVRDVWPEATIAGIELDQVRAESSGATCADALAVAWGRPRLIVTNPPFGLAMEFVQRALEEVARGGTVAMLLRLPWLASQRRAEWIRANTPSVYVLPRRPSFTGKGSDATDYGWMVWDGRAPTVRILDVT